VAWQKKSAMLMDPVDTVAAVILITTPPASVAEV
tara:strand:+ start:513 stop:614 length:102 start_codon:yes stop_codon:yes gene_type:complete